MPKKELKWIAFLGALLTLLILSVSLALVSGEMDIRLSEVIPIMRSKSGIEYAILAQIRLPRIILALSIGGALSLTGALLQGIYRNPLVEPYTLGISGGAALGIALIIVLGIHEQLGAVTLPLAGFSGLNLSDFLR